jgi:hypothetical protein
MQLVITSRASLGALKHAQSFVTSSQPDGSANPIGIRQLKTQGACDTTTGSAVMLYSKAELFAVVLIAVLVVIVLLPCVDTDVGDCA